MSIRENISELIKKKGMKQKYVAERAGFTEADFSNMMRGKKIIRAEYLPVIARAIGVDMNTIVGMDQSANNNYAKQ